MNLEFPAMRGIMGGETYYVAMVKLENVPTLFDTYLDRKEVQARDKEEIDLQKEAQRRMNLKRIPEIAEYILDSVNGKSRFGYVFNSITANCTADMHFREISPDTNLGLLQVKDFAKFTVADGQHRLRGIKEALAKSRSKQLRSESIAVVFFDVRNKKTKEADILRQHQIFTDLNRNAQKITGGLLAGMGNQPNEIIARHLVEKIPLFDGLVEMEKTSPSKSSEHIFSLAAIKQTVDIIVGGRPDRAELEKNTKIVESIWKKMIESMPIWREAANREIDTKTIKVKYVCTHAVVVRGLAAIVSRINQLPANEAKEKIKILANMDWKKSNPFFKSKILDENGSIINSKTSERILVNALIKKLRIEDEEA